MAYSNVTELYVFESIDVCHCVCFLPCFQLRVLDLRQNLLHSIDEVDALVAMLPQLSYIGLNGNDQLTRNPEIFRLVWNEWNGYVCSLICVYIIYFGYENQTLCFGSSAGFTES